MGTIGASVPSRSVTRPAGLAASAASASARARSASRRSSVARLPSVRRLLRPGFAVPILLALAGVALIIVGQLNIDPPCPRGRPPPDPGTPADRRRAGHPFSAQRPAIGVPDGKPYPEPELGRRPD